MISASKKEFIEFMMSADVLRFGEFKTKSGRLSPYFVNTGIDPLATSAAGALAREYNVDKPYFFNRKEAKDHGEGGNLVGYQPKDGDRIIIIEDVITAGTAVRETVPILQNAAKVTIPDMFISVNRCEVGQNPGKTAVMEVKEQFGINVHAIITVADIYEYLKEKPEYASVLANMEKYMEQYCIL